MPQNNSISPGLAHIKLLACCVLLGIPLLSFGNAGPVKQDVPADVKQFIDRRDSCDHFRGEEAYDDKRAAFLETKVKEYCKGTDKQLTALRKKYVRNKIVIKALKNYESNIE